MKRPFSIHPLSSLQDNYIWALLDHERSEVCIVDPGEAEPVETYLSKNRLTLKSILITHHHGDHTNGVAALRAAHAVPVYGPQNPRIPEITQTLRENELVPNAACPLAMRVLAIPGHTLDHLAYYGEDLLFCGDTLFAAGCGRIFEGSPSQMYSSLQKLLALPDETQVYCAHEYTLQNLRFAQTVEPDNLAVRERMKTVQCLREKGLPSLPSALREERQTNPFLRCDSPSLKAAVEKYAGQSLANSLEVFQWLRKWKDGFK